MFGLSHHEIAHLLSSYGYWAVLLFVGIESLGFPLPGETVLLAAAIYAGTHDGGSVPGLNIVLVILAAAAGTGLGGSAGYWIGREFGYELLLRHGRFIHLDEKKMKLGQYLFLKHGGKVVFFGRFVAVLRAFASLLAGINRMDWRRFFLVNLAGGTVWSAVFGLAGFFFGKQVHRLLGTVGIIVLVVVVIGLVAGIILIRRHQARLEDEAERAFPGPLEHAIGGRRSKA
jgi:membrane protein DedA with SNARE-associated domain